MQDESTGCLKVYGHAIKKIQGVLESMDKAKMSKGYPVDGFTHIQGRCSMDFKINCKYSMSSNSTGIFKLIFALLCQLTWDTL